MDYEGIVMKMLAVQHVSKQYEDKRVVSDLSFEIREGEIFGLLGPNGAGKTTTIEMIAGLQAPSSGSIKLLGTDGFCSGHYRALGVQLQAADLYGNLTVRETLHLFLSFHGRTSALDEHISLTRLNGFLEQKVKHLSGGQKQRLSLSLSLANDPRLLILDEPTVGLDPQSRRLLWDIIGELKEQGKTILLTTHFMDEAQLLCDRVAIIDDGQLLVLDTVEGLLQRAESRYTLVIETTPGVPPHLDLDEAHVLVIEEESTLRLKTNAIDPVLAQVMHVVQKEKLQINTLSIKETNLEDLFLQLTGKELRE